MEPGKESEFREYYQSYAPIIHGRCSRILKSKDDGWDATQEVFMRLMNSMHTIRDKRFVLAWLLKTSTNYCISRLRRRRECSYEENREYADSISVESAESRILSRQVMHNLLKSWDVKTVEIVLYTYIDEYSQEEISAITGMGTSTIRRYLTRFRRNVQKWKEKYE